ncbi:MAG: 6-phosphogluconolactonase [Vampirovibrionales bacterium]|nr:6-phosphogluconolactonase [Vampirovibrionales bacterium]
MSRKLIVMMKPSKFQTSKESKAPCPYMRGLDKNLRSVCGQGFFQNHPYGWETKYYNGPRAIEAVQTIGKVKGNRKQNGIMKWVTVKPGENSPCDSTKTAVGHMAASLIAQQLNETPDSVFIFPTGNTPKPMYEALRSMPGLNWRQAKLFHLDEYVQKPELGLSQEQTFKNYLNKELWEANPAISQARRYYLQDYLHNPKGYEDKIKAVGHPDVVVLGIGGNGHIAFIEPGFDPKVASHIHTVHLAEKTLNDNFPNRKSPQNPNGEGYSDEAVTLGLETILSARHIILLATGNNKKAILKKAFGDFSEPPTPEVPASYLKMHPNVTVITDVTLND